MAKRIKGQETEIVVLKDNAPVVAITAIRSHSVTFNNDVLTEEYLGETSVRKDAIFKGIAGNIEAHLDDPDFFDFVVAVNDKNRSRTPNTQINVKTTLQFSDGRRRRVVAPDVEFGNIPLNFASRSDYGTYTLDYEGGDVSFV